MKNDEGQVVVPAPPRCHVDQHFWRQAGLCMNYRESMSICLSRAPPHTDTAESLLVLHTIDLSNARASLTWQEMKRHHTWAALHSWNNPRIGQSRWVRTSAEKTVYVVFSMLVSLLSFLKMRLARRLIRLPEGMVWLASIVLLFLCWPTSINQPGPDLKLMLVV